MDALFYGFSVMLFAVVILLTEGAYLWWSGTHGGGAQRIARRLRLMSGGSDAAREQVSILKQRRYSSVGWVDALLHRLRLAHAIDRALVQSGLRWSVAQFVGATFGGLLLALLLLQLRPVPLVATLVVSLLFMSVPYFLVQRPARRA